MVKKIGLFFLILFLLMGFSALYIYKSKALTIQSETYFRVHKNDNITILSARLNKEMGLKYPYLFELLSRKMNLERWIKNGRFTLKPNMTMIELIRELRSGKAQTVNFVIKGLTDLDKFANNCGASLEPDKEDFLFALNDTNLLDSLGFNLQTVYALPLPDTYNMYWHTQADELLFKLKKEYDLYWNNERVKKAENLGLTPIQVSVLASIVCKETSKNDEMPKVAQLYLNRLKLNMALQADPTVIFANKDKEIRRVLNEHLQVESPYNTYKNKGLPPGPICIPSKQAIEAVLNPAQHNDIYMCAKEDFSGYHNFAETYSNHLLNAKRYQAALDMRKIMK